MPGTPITNEPLGDWCHIPEEKGQSQLQRQLKLGCDTPIRVPFLNNFSGLCVLSGVDWSVCETASNGGAHISYVRCQDGSGVDEDTAVVCSKHM